MVGVRGLILGWKKVKQKCKEFPEDVFEGFREPERR